MKWEMTTFAMVNYCPKGDFYFSEAYGVFENEVPSPEEPSTMLNVSLINLLKKADEILIAGEALSHCVATSVFQLADNIGEENISKLVLLKDCCSSVPGFEYLGDKFVADMTARGMRVSNSLDYIQSR
jgi:nicotinamidase-related amidase